MTTDRDRKRRLSPNHTADGGHREDMTAEAGPTVAQDGHHPKTEGRRDAEVEHVVGTLRTYGVLTRARLEDLCRAVYWSEPDFRQALAAAIASGRVKRLPGDFYEAVDL